MAISHARGFDQSAFVGKTVGLVEKTQVDDAFESDRTKRGNGLRGRLSGGGEMLGDGSILSSNPGLLNLGVEMT